MAAYHGSCGAQRLVDASSYRVEPDGTLTAPATYDVGQLPSWVLAISVEAT